MPETPQRNIVFFGETGTGKSSAINLLLQTDASSAPVSNDTQPCTQSSARYETTLDGTRYTLWDTRGLGEGRTFLSFFGFGGNSEKELKKFLKQRQQRDEIDLLVFCVRGSRATDSAVKYYNNVFRELAVPVVVVVTCLEREPNDMEDWWIRNSSGFEKCMKGFDDHVCITTLPGHPRTAESKTKLVDLITKKRRWQAEDTGPYTSSPIQTSTHSVPSPPKGGVLSRLKAGYIDEVRRVPSRRFGGFPGTSSPASSTKGSSYYTAPSPGVSEPSSPIVEPPTPSSATIHIHEKVAPIDTKLLGADGPPQPSSEDTYSAGASLYSLCTGSHTSHTSHSQVDLQPCTGDSDSEDYLMSELPFKHSAATVIKKKGYPTRQGSYGDIWECDLIFGESSRMVAVKAVKTNTDDYRDLASHEKKLRRELRVWAGLQHRNIVPLLGIVSEFGRLPSMVSPWFSNGSLCLYVARHQLSKMQKHVLLGDVAAGLCYLHSRNVTHGDLHSDNVLIDDDGRACLTDFGLSFLSEFVGTPYLKSNICGAVQFADPSLVQRANKMKLPEGVVYPTKPCDVYSFGGLMLHVLSGKQPFDGLAPGTIVKKVLEGKRPPIPTNYNHVILNHKSLMRRCWDRDESKRPLAADLARMFVTQ